MNLKRLNSMMPGTGYEGDFFFLTIFVLGIIMCIIGGLIMRTDTNNYEGVDLSCTLGISSMQPSDNETLNLYYLKISNDSVRWCQLDTAELKKFGENK